MTRSDVTSRRPPQTHEAAADYAELRRRVRAAGLLEKRPGFSVAVGLLMLAALAVLVYGMVLTGPSAYQLLFAVAIGLVLTQLAFLAHEASHRAIFRSGPANDWTARLIGALVGVSFVWWKGGHVRHHAHPNVRGRDPSVEGRVLTFLPEDATQDTRLRAWYTRRQAYFLIPLLLLSGVSMQVGSLLAMTRRGRVEARWTELAMLTVRHVIVLTGLLLLLPPALVAGFLAVQIMVLGIGTAFAFLPNHMGLPILDRRTQLDFLRRQATMSRDIRGGWLVTTAMGGLNFQIEHHLFPSMARQHLRPARDLVREYCGERGVLCHENTLGEAWSIIFRYLNEVGLAAARRASRCPTSAGFGR